MVFQTARQMTLYLARHAVHTVEEARLADQRAEERRLAEESRLAEEKQRAYEEERAFIQVQLPLVV
jgi:hypothetical protein